MSNVKLVDIPFEAKHGVLPIEKEQPNKFLVDVMIKTDISKAAASDDISDGVDYSLLYKAAKKVMTGPSRNLLESLCNDIADEVLKIDKVDSVKVRIKKLHPLNCGGAQYSEVTIKKK